MTPMANRVNIPNLALWGAVSITGFAILVSIEQANGLLTSADLIIYTSGMIGLFCLTGLRMEIWGRPKAIEIVDDGVNLYLRARRPIKIIWRDITYVNVVTDSSVKRDWNYSDSALFTRSMNGHKSKAYVLHYSLSLAIREKYKEVVGNYPPNSFSGIPP